MLSAIEVNAAKIGSLIGVVDNIQKLDDGTILGNIEMKVDVIVGLHGGITITDKVAIKDADHLKAVLKALYQHEATA